MTDFASVWAYLKSYKDQSLIGTFQEFVQEEEFEFSTFIDDLHDVEDESTIVEWFTGNGHTIETFRIIKQLILDSDKPVISSSYTFPSLHSNNNNNSNKTVVMNTGNVDICSFDPIKKSKTVNICSPKHNYKQNTNVEPASLSKQPSLPSLHDIINNIKDPNVIAQLLQRAQFLTNNSSNTTANANMTQGQMMSHPPGTYDRQNSISNMKMSMESFNSYTSQELDVFEKFCVDEEVQYSLFICMYISIFHLFSISLKMWQKTLKHLKMEIVLLLIICKKSAIGVIGK